MKINQIYEYFYPGVITSEVLVLPKTRKFAVEGELDDKYQIRFEDDGSRVSIMKNSLICKNAKEINNEQI